VRATGWWVQGSGTGNPAQDEVVARLVLRRFVQEAAAERELVAEAHLTVTRYVQRQRILVHDLGAVRPDDDLTVETKATADGLEHAGDPRRHPGRTTTTTRGGPGPRPSGSPGPAATS
jgi:hypothetical protein